NEQQQRKTFVGAVFVWQRYIEPNRQQGRNGHYRNAFDNAFGKATIRFPQGFAAFCHRAISCRSFVSGQQKSSICESSVRPARPRLKLIGSTLAVLGRRRCGPWAGVLYSLKFAV